MADLAKATFEDMTNAVEVDGTPTDLHTLQASAMFQVDYKKVTRQQREAGKRENYFQMYGAGRPQTFNASMFRYCK